MIKIYLCEICGREIKPDGLSTVIIKDRHKITKYYHEECIERESARNKKGTYTDN